MMHGPAEIYDLSLAIAQFNDQQFFQCHETLEQIWLRQTGLERQYVQGIIQIAVGYHHLLSGNQAGAIKLFKRGLQRITSHRPDNQDIDTTRLIVDVGETISHLENADSPEVGYIHIPRIHRISGDR